MDKKPIYQSAEKTERNAVVNFIGHLRAVLGRYEPMLVMPEPIGPRQLFIYKIVWFRHLFYLRYPTNGNSGKYGDFVLNDLTCVCFRAARLVQNLKPKVRRCNLSEIFW